MADTSKPAEPVKPYVFDEAAFQNKVTLIQSEVDKKAGKPNFNPFKFLAEQGVDEMVKQFKLGTRSQELFDKMQQVPSTIPCIDPNWTPPEPPKAVLPKALQPPTAPSSKT